MKTPNIELFKDLLPTEELEATGLFPGMTQETITLRLVERNPTRTGGGERLKFEISYFDIPLGIRYLFLQKNGQALWAE